MKTRSELAVDKRRDELLLAVSRVVARKSIAHVTIRDIAKEAGVSAGLLHHYFGNKEGLLSDLFAWLGQLMLAEPAIAAVTSNSSASERMLLTVRSEIMRAMQYREGVQLFFDFWVQGSIDPAFRERVSELLRLYRQRFLPIAREMVSEDPDRFQDSAPEGLAGVAASFVQGCAVQVMADPDGFDIEAHLATAEALLCPMGVA